VVAQTGRTVYLAGQTAQRPDGSLVDGTMAEQFDVAAGNVVLALEGAGARPQDLVSLQIFVTDVDEYRKSAPPTDGISAVTTPRWRCSRSAGSSIPKPRSS
jgi:enamine deaminase RidA (YjgF/YER057c/UK114 family)